MSIGISWPRYIAFFATGFLSMLAGAQWVHQIYKPLDDLEDLVERRLKERLRELEETEPKKNVV